MSKNTTKPDAFAGLADMMSGGFDTGMSSEAAPRTMFRLEDIEVEAQDREELEDDENSLDELGESLLVLQLQPIGLRKGRTKPYLLVWGHRRYFAAERKAMPELWGEYHPDMTDEQASLHQFAENVQRKNLTQMEEARRVQRDIAELGSVDAVLAKHKKSRAWLSKITSLLNLPEQTKRLVKENISADLEVIGAVKAVEKVDPKKAAKLVDDLKQSRGKTSAREQVAKVKDEVKPSKKAAAKKDGGSVATPRNRDIEDPSEGEVFAPAKQPRASGRPLHEAALTKAYVSIFEQGKSPKSVLDALGEDELSSVEDELAKFYEAGKQATDAARVVMEGFRNGGFSSDGAGAFAMVAYLHGADGKAKFNLLNIFGTMKA